MESVEIQPIPPSDSSPPGFGFKAKRHGGDDSAVFLQAVAQEFQALVGRGQVQRCHDILDGFNFGGQTEGVCAVHFRL